jgi:AcrR family transcriptional regulator
MAKGLRERKKERTRQALIDAAVALFSERGFAGATVEDIAAAAEVSPSTFFRYFGTKEDVLFDDYEVQIERWAAALGEGPPGETLGQALRRATLALLDAQRDAAQALHVSARLQRDEPALARRSLELDARAVERGAIAIAEWLGVDAETDLRPLVIAAAVRGALFAATRRWSATGHAATPAELVEAAFDLLGRLGDELATPRPSPG